MRQHPREARIASWILSDLDEARTDLCRLHRETMAPKQSFWLDRWRWSDLFRPQTWSASAL